MVRRHAEANCIKNHAKIDDIEARKIIKSKVIAFKYEYQIGIQTIGEITQKSRENDRNVVKNRAKFEAWKFVTPKASAPKPRSKSEK